MRKSKNSVVWLLVVALLWTSVTFLPVASANVPSMDKIRVALLIDTGKYYRQVEPFVTLSSASGLKVFWKGKDPAFAYIDTIDKTKHRFSLDQFSLKVIETTDLKQAQDMVRLLQGQAVKSTIWKQSLSGQTLYAVVAGSYANSDLAYKMAFTLNQTLGVNPQVMGPERWDAGTFATKEEAKALQDKIVAKGFAAWMTTVRTPDGTAAFSVRVGDEVDANALNALKDRVQSAIPDVTLTPVDKTIGALIERDTIASNGNAVRHYFFNSDIQNLSIVPNVTGTQIPPLVEVGEKGGRKYRGVIELSNYGGFLTVINELPMEEYLYSVVSSEMASGWHPEALKAQAVAARTYAVGLGLKYVVAHLSDSTYDQAYKGYTIEKQDVRDAVIATRGQVLMLGSKLATAYYYSNAGGTTADPSEVWSGDIPNLKPVPSPDEIVLRSSPIWYRVMLTDGTLGYVRSDLVRVLDKTDAAGRPYVEANVPNLNFRTGPSTYEHTSLRQLNIGEKGIMLKQVFENSSYNWIRGPIDGTTLMNTINTNSLTGLLTPVYMIDVTKRGPSGRAVEVMVNGTPLVVSTPDRIRTAFGSLRSTLFEVEQMGAYTVLGAEGKQVSLPRTNPNELHAISAGGKVTKGLNGTQDAFFIQGTVDKLRIATESVQFRFHGKGFGHGSGMSQWGAKGLAESGYGYEQILKHYYSEQITITPVKP